MAASLEKVGEELLTFYCFPTTQHKSLQRTNAIERLQEQFRRRVKTQGSLPSEKAALLVFFGLFASRQVKTRGIEGWSDLAASTAAAACKKLTASQEKSRYLLLHRNRDTAFLLPKIICFDTDGTAPLWSRFV